MKADPNCMHKGGDQINITVPPYCDASYYPGSGKTSYTFYNKSAKRAKTAETVGAPVSVTMLGEAHSGAQLVGGRTGADLGDYSGEVLSEMEAFKARQAAKATPGATAIENQADSDE